MQGRQPMQPPQPLPPQCLHQAQAITVLPLPLPLVAAVRFLDLGG